MYTGPRLRSFVAFFWLGSRTAGLKSQRTIGEEEGQQTFR